MKEEKTTKVKIIEAAIELLISQGYSNFSQKKVAQKCGISPGNLTYHFEKKSDLINAIVDHWYKLWIDEFKSSIPTIIMGDRTLGEFINWVLEEAVKEENAVLYRELWSIANQSPHVAHRLHNLYDEAITFAIKEIFFEIPPEDIHDARALMYVLACASEGAAAVSVSMPESGANFLDIKDKLKELLLPEFRRLYRKSARQMQAAAFS